MGVLLLPRSEPLRLTLRLRPLPGCREAGVLAGYKGPRDTQGVLARGGALPRLGYVRFSGSKAIAPPTAEIGLGKQEWKKGFLLVVEIRRDGIVASTGKGRRFSWPAPGPLTGKTALFARGPALFRIVKEEPLRGETPRPDPSRLWSRLPPFRKKRARRALAELLDRALPVPEEGNRLPPRLAGPAWLWTGASVFRRALDDWARRPPPLPPDPEGRALRVLDEIALYRVLPDPDAPKVLERLERDAAALAAARGEDGLWEGARLSPRQAWFLPGLALLESLSLVRGPRSNRIFQAWRSAMNRLVEALLPGKEGEVEARRWSTRDLLAAGLFLARSSSRRAALSTSLETVERILEEERMSLDQKGMLLLLEKDGRPAPKLLLSWARFLVRLGEGAGREGYREAALRGASACLEPPGEVPLSFPETLRLMEELPRLIPQGALGILATTGRVVSILKDRETLSWTTAGPSRETLAAGYPGLRLEERGKTLSLSGPLVQVDHESTQVVLRAARTQSPPHRPSSPTKEAP